jgi:eukaryotic-like serine/threonine-protein kinase
MKKKFLLFAKVIGLVAFYSLVLVAAVYITMETLIKGEDVNAPDFQGKNIVEAKELATKHNVYLKEIVGNYDQNYDPQTVINQVPAPGVRIKEKSFIKVFVTSDLVEVIVPDLSGYNLNDCEKLLRENELRKRYISYMDADDVPVDFVISQSFPAGTRVPSGSEIDILVSRGSREKSYIMPDLIGKSVADVISYFENLGLKISKKIEISYPGLDVPGLVLKQHPLSGFRINAKARISIEVSK